MAETRRIPIPEFRAWTSLDHCPPGYLGRWTRNLSNARGHFAYDQGFKRFRQIQTASENVGGASWIHQDATGAQWPVYWNEDAIYPETGSDAAAALVSSLTASFSPSFANLATFNQSVIFNGTDADASLIRENAGGTALEREPFDWSISSRTATSTAAAGGTIADGTYQVRTALIDDTVAPTVFSAPDQDEITTAGGGTSTITIFRPVESATRAANWRYAITAAGATDTPANYTRYVDVSYGTASVTITSLPSAQTDQAFVDRNGVYRQSHLPQSNVEFGKIHDGRLFIGSTQDDEVYFSERGNINHWFPTNGVTSGAESSFNSPPRAFAIWNGLFIVFTSSSVHVVSGTFRRDDEGTSPTYALDANQDTVRAGLGLLGGHMAVTTTDRGIYFMSTLGPAVWRGAITLLRPNGVDHLAMEMRCWDRTYVDRWFAVEDPTTGMIGFGVTRVTNSSREMDGAATAGIVDTVYRWNPYLGEWSAPLWCECVHLINRPNGTANTKNNRPRLMGVGPHGTVQEWGFGWSGGDVDGVVSASDFDGMLAASSTTTTVVYASSGITDGALRGHTLTLFYPSGDTGFEFVTVQRTLVNNVTAGGNITLTWSGALTVPTGTEWTARISALAHFKDWYADIRDYMEMAPDEFAQLQSVELRMRDRIGAEAVA